MGTNIYSPREFAETGRLWRSRWLSAGFSDTTGSDTTNRNSTELVHGDVGGVRYSVSLRSVHYMRVGSGGSRHSQWSQLY